jgi:uncharacterized protein
MTCLPDSNVWLALAVAEHIHHDAARRWFETADPDILAFCRVTQMGFLRLLTNPRVMQEDALKPARAWKLLDQFCENRRIVSAEEPPGVEARWRALTAARPCGASFWTDAYLAAFASVAGHTLVTFDKGFSRFDELRLHLLG